MRPTGRRDDTFGHPDGVAVLPRDIFDGLEAFKEIILKAGGRIVADHEHSCNLVFDVQLTDGKGPARIYADMAVHEAKRVKIISRANNMNGSIEHLVKYPFVLQINFTGQNGATGGYGATQIGFPAVADFPSSMTKIHFAYHCLKTLVNEWQAHLPNIPFPLHGRRLKMPDGVELLPEQLVLATLPP